MITYGQADRVEHLDWLRALAITLVVFTHTTVSIAPGGAVGVSVFFVLSGYLIAGMLMREGMLGSGNVGRFIVRRVARIYPMYALHLCALVAGLWLLKSRHLDPVLSALPALMTFTHPLRDLPGYGFAVLWSLAAEFWFYVSFPFVLAAARYTGRPTLVLCAALVASIAAKFTPLSAPVLLYYDHFIVGALAYSFAERAREGSLRIPRRTATAGLVVILLTAAVPYPGEWNAAWYVQSLTAALGAALFLVGAGSSGFVDRKMPAVAFIGRISFSMYLVHALLIDVPLRLTTNMPLYIALLIAISTGTYFLIEQPFIRFVHRRVKFRQLAPEPLGALRT